MKIETKGYVIIQLEHPSIERKRIMNSTFRIYKKDCIEEFVNGSMNSWKFWRDKYNFKCVRATETIETELP